MAKLWSITGPMGGEVMIDYEHLSIMAYEDTINTQNNAMAGSRETSHRDGMHKIFIAWIFNLRKTHIKY